MLVDNVSWYINIQIICPDIISLLDIVWRFLWCLFCQPRNPTRPCHIVFTMKVNQPKGPRTVGHWDTPCPLSRYGRTGYAYMYIHIYIYILLIYIYIYYYIIFIIYIIYIYDIVLLLYNLYTLQGVLWKMQPHPHGILYQFYCLEARGNKERLPQTRWPPLSCTSCIVAWKRVALDALEEIHG